MFLGRPARMQLRGSPLLDWAENLPPVPLDVHRAHVAHVDERLVERLGGSGPAWPPLVDGPAGGGSRIGQK
jgi:hypothetical protein